MKFLSKFLNSLKEKDPEEAKALRHARMMAKLSRMESVNVNKLPVIPDIRILCMNKTSKAGMCTVLFEYLPEHRFCLLGLGKSERNVWLMEYTGKSAPEQTGFTANIIEWLDKDKAASRPVTAVKALAKAAGLACNCQNLSRKAVNNSFKKRG